MATNWAANTSILIPIGSMATPFINEVRVTKMIEIIETEDDCSVLINGEELEILNADDDFVSATCDACDLEDVPSGSFPEKLTLEVHDEDNFGTQLFEEVTISVDNGVIVLDFGFNIYNKYWEGLYGLSTFVEAVHEQVMKANNFQVLDIETEDAWKRMTLRCQMPQEESILQAINKVADELKLLEEAAEIDIIEQTIKSLNELKQKKNNKK